MAAKLSSEWTEITSEYTCDHCSVANSGPDSAKLYSHPTLTIEILCADCALEAEQWERENADEKE
jgi:hypothetical protein